jgi:ATP-binding cassette, subfamily C (CFTR/MRP), member 1
VLAETALIASGSTYVAAIIPLSLGALYILQKYYLRTSRQMRHLDLEMKSPLYTQFIETLAGLMTIRAFGWKQEAMGDNARLLNLSQKPNYMLYCIQRWLNVVLDLFVACIALSLVAFALNFASGTSKGAIGLAMVNIIGFNKSLTLLIELWTGLETSLGAIARLKYFMASTPQETQDTECQDPPAQWPSKGVIEIKNVTASYRYLNLYHLPLYPKPDIANDQ